MSQTKNDDPVRGFRVTDLDKNEFTLWDGIFNKTTRWKLTEDFRPGLGLLMESIDKEISKLPKPSDIKKNFKDMSETQRIEYIEKVNKLSHKQIFILASMVEPLDPIPDLFENKVEFLASCLTTEKDAGKIHAFFLIRFSNGSTSDGEFHDQIKQMLNNLGE